MSPSSPNAITCLLKNVSKPKSFDQAVTAEGKLDKEIAEKFGFLEVSEISFLSFTDHRHLRAIGQDARTQYRSNRNEYRMDRIEKTQNAIFEEN